MVLCLGAHLSRPRRFIRKKNDVYHQYKSLLPGITLRKEDFLIKKDLSLSANPCIFEIRHQGEVIC